MLPVNVMILLLFLFTRLTHQGVASRVDRAYPAYLSHGFGWFYNGHFLYYVNYMSLFSKTCFFVIKNFVDGVWFAEMATKQMYMIDIQCSLGLWILIDLHNQGFPNFL
ncbi:hypothetical protein ACJX0J_020712, partial [Zea mays]